MGPARDDRGRTFTVLRLPEYVAQMRINREVIRRNELAFQQGTTVLGELIEEIRAHTQAIFQLIDRLDGGPARA